MPGGAAGANAWRAGLLPSNLRADAILSSSKTPACKVPARWVQCNHGGSMKTRIVRIGNSQGVRIPKPLLEQTGLRDNVEIEVEDDHLVIRAVGHPRAGWAEAFQAMAQHGDDALLDGDVLCLTRWEEEEWEW